MHLKWCIIVLLAFVSKIYGSDCLSKVNETFWVRCNEEGERKFQELQEKTSNKYELIRQECCGVSDTMTCLIDSLRSECGDGAANSFIKNLRFMDDCASWTYPESISQCQLWYTKWWLLTTVTILAIIVIASLVVWGLRIHARRSY